MEKKEIIKQLKFWCRKSKYNLYTKVDSVSQNGMNRGISIYASVNGDIINLNWYIEQLGIYKHKKGKNSLNVSGCGMDMCFAVVYNLSCALYCPKKYDHNAAYKLSKRDL